VTRFGAVLQTDLRLELRFAVLPAIGGLALAWAALLMVLPREASRVAAPLLLFVDTATIGTFFLGALVVLERVEGARQALAISPLRFREYAAAKVGTLVAASVVGTIPIVIVAASTPAEALLSLAGVGLTASFILLVALSIAVTQRSLIGFLLTVPFIAIPFIAPPLAHAVGLAVHPLLYVVPTVGAYDLIATGFDSRQVSVVWSVFYPLAACALAGALASWQWRRGLLASEGAARLRLAVSSSAPTNRAPVRRPVLWAFWRTDLLSIRRDSLLPILASAPLLLALALRFGYPLAERWLATAHGLDLVPFRPVLLAAAVVLHVPLIFGMMAALLVLEESDDRTLLALRVSPVTLERYLAYRVGVAAVATAVGLAVAVPLSGLVAPDQLAGVAPALIPAVALAPLMALTVTAFAANKVEAITVVKLLGLPFYLPLAAWFMSPPLQLIFTPFPSYWILRSLWTSVPLITIGGATAALALALVAGSGMWRRTVRRLGA
jgi:fluoroquinolone transport system permease protein